jgi:L-ascorbate metabolism protein UlaG (beta-lactamase superfamily)
MSIQNVPKANTVLFTWFNKYAGVLLRTRNKILIIDPVDIMVQNFPIVDAVLITHEHYDHLDPVVITAIQRASSCLVIADVASSTRLRDVISKEMLKIARPGESFRIGDVEVKVELCKHPAQAPVTYVLTSEDGVSLYHTADSLPFPELSSIGEREQFDAVFCTVGIAPNATAQTGFEIARLTKPKLAIPYHTSTIESQREFADLINQKLPAVHCLIPEKNKVYQISKKV